MRKGKWLIQAKCRSLRRRTSSPSSAHHQHIITTHGYYTLQHTMTTAHHNSRPPLRIITTYCNGTDVCSQQTATTNQTMTTRKICRKIRKRSILDRQSADVDVVVKANRKFEYNADGAIDSLVQNVVPLRLIQIHVTSAETNDIEKVKQHRN